MAEYWALTWLESEGIKNVGDLKASLTSKSVIGDLKRSAKLLVDSWRTSNVEKRPFSLIAGSGIDLSGRLDCNGTECRRAQVDRLFRRAWHYFETVVARDAIAEDLILHRDCPDEEVRERLLPHFETVLIVRELGAIPLVEFMPRVPACFKHWRDHAKEAGIEDIVDQESRIVDQLLKESQITFSNRGKEVLCTLDNADFSHTQWVRFSKEDARRKSEEALKREALGKVVRSFVVNLTADVKAARLYGGSFGSTIPVFGKILTSRGPKISNIAFQLELPALDGLTTAQLIETRLKYENDFSRFRKRLHSFIEECVNEGLTQSAQIHNKLRADLIEGELEELRRNLAQTEEALKRKSGYALSLASLVATIGVATGVITPPVAFGLAATISAASLSPGVSKYVDDTVKLKSHDLYFLLQAESHAH